MIDELLAQFDDEHQAALRQLDHLEAALIHLERGEQIELHLNTVRDVHAFLATAVREHNETEERELFGLLAHAGLCEPFESEHRQLRELEHRLADELNSANPVHSVQPIIHEIVSLLRTHIAREDAYLFPKVRELLTSGGSSALPAHE